MTLEQLQSFIVVVGFPVVVSIILLWGLLIQFPRTMHHAIKELGEGIVQAIRQSQLDQSQALRDMDTVLSERTRTALDALRRDLARIEKSINEGRRGSDRSESVPS